MAQHWFQWSRLELLEGRTRGSEACDEDVCGVLVDSEGVEGSGDVPAARNVVDDIRV